MAGMARPAAKRTPFLKPSPALYLAASDKFVRQLMKKGVFYRIINAVYQKNLYAKIWE